MIRPRRYRLNKNIRALVEDVRLSVNDLILPVFVHDQLEPRSIESLPGHNCYDQISLLNYCEQILKSGIKAIALFPSIRSK